MADVDAFLVALSKIVYPIELYFQWRPQLADPNDEMVLEAAINGRVSAIATHNLHDCEPAFKLFGIRVISPSQSLQELRNERSR